MPLEKDLDEIISKVSGKNKNIVVGLFEYVQGFPYKVLPYKEPFDLVKYGAGDCRHKQSLLFELYKRIGLHVKKIKVIFNWDDLPLPKELLDILKKSSHRWGHDSLLIKVREKEILVDPTWDPKLKPLGFPVTENWSGNENTLSVSKGYTEIMDTSAYEEFKKGILKDPKEVKEFADKLNSYLEKKRKIPYRPLCSLALI